MENKYRVYWVSQVTGKSGMGEPLSKADAEAWAEYGNKEYPDIWHFVREVSP